MSDKVSIYERWREVKNREPEKPVNVRRVATHVCNHCAYAEKGEPGFVRCSLEGGPVMSLISTERHTTTCDTFRFLNYAEIEAGLGVPVFLAGDNNL